MMPEFSKTAAPRKRKGEIEYAEPGIKDYLTSGHLQ